MSKSIFCEKNLILLSIIATVIHYFRLKGTSQSGSDASLEAQISV